MGVWGAIANKMEASQETCFWAKITQASLQIIKRYVPKKKASIQLYLNFLKAYVEKLERNYIYIWGSGRHFKESDKMEVCDLFLLFFGSAP